MKLISVPHITSHESIDAQGTNIKIDTLDWPKDFWYKPEVSAKLGHTDDRLFVKFHVMEEHAQAVTTFNNGPVWEDSAVEFFVKTPESPFYYNFENNCIGAILVARRTGRSDAQHFTDDQIAKITHISSLAQMQPYTLNGVASEPKPLADTAKEWTLLLGIPFESIGIPFGQVPSILNANFYKCGDKTKIPHYLSWSPIATDHPDFHRPEFFGKLLLL
jgi:hypothetical protein